MRKLFFVILLFIMLPFICKAADCECPSINEDNWISIVQKSVRQAHLVFIGEVISSDARSYSIRVLDSFKGSIKPGGILSGNVEDNCSVLPDKGGIWVIYAMPLGKGFIKINACSIARNLVNLSIGIPPLQLPNSYGKATYEEWELVRQPLLVKNWINEYVLLNAYRNQHNRIEEPKNTSKDYLPYIAIGLSAIALAVAFIKKS